MGALRGTRSSAATTDATIGATTAAFDGATAATVICNTSPDGERRISISQKYD